MADRMATVARSFSAHGLAARELCHAACFAKTAQMSLFTEALQKIAHEGINIDVSLYSGLSRAIQLGAVVRQSRTYMQKRVF